MVNFYLKIDTSTESVTGDPELDLLEEGTFDFSENHIIMAINLTEEQARIFQFKLKNDPGTDSIAGNSDVMFRYKHDPNRVGANKFVNWPVFLNHWHNWKDDPIEVGHTQFSASTYQGLDKTLANKLSQAILETTTNTVSYTQLFNNHEEVLAHCGQALNNSLKNIRNVIHGAAETLTSNGNDLGTDDGLQPHSTDTSGNSIPEYLFQRLMNNDSNSDSKNRFLAANLSNPSLNTQNSTTINAGTTSCFSANNDYTDWVDIPLCNNDKIFIEFTATVNFVNNFAQDYPTGHEIDNSNKTTVNTNSLTNQKATVLINIVNKSRSDITEAVSSSIPEGKLNNIDDLNYVEARANYYYSESNHVGPYINKSGATDDYPIFKTSGAATQYTDINGDTNTNTLAKEEVIAGATYYRNAVSDLNGIINASSYERGEGTPGARDYQDSHNIAQ
jgi:hypothetical protein